jgi:hypothetical protein
VTSPLFWQALHSAAFIILKLRNTEVAMRILVENHGPLLWENAIGLTVIDHIHPL